MAHLRSFGCIFSKFLSVSKLSTRRSLGRFGNITPNLEHACYRSTFRDNSAPKNTKHQEIIEDRVFIDKGRSEAIISKVNNLIASGNAGRLFAVIQIISHQVRVSPEDLLTIEHCWPPIVGDKVVFEKVLLLGSPSFTLVGKPILPQNLVRVYGTVIHKDLTHTKMRYRFVHKERIHKLNFERPELTYVRINDIELHPKLNTFEETEYNRI